MSFRDTMILAWVVLVLAVGAFWGVNHFFGPDRPTEVAEQGRFGQIPLDQGGGFSDRTLVKLRQRCPGIVRRDPELTKYLHDDRVEGFCDCFVGWLDERLRANAISSADIDAAADSGKPSFALQREWQRLEQRCRP